MNRAARLSPIARLCLAAVIFGMPFATAPRAQAISSSGIVRNVHYVAAFQPIFNNDIPFSGTMILNYNHGVISGTYNDMSIRPGGPLANRMNAAIVGGVNGEDIHFTIGNVLAFNGKLEGDTIDGSATFRGRLYQFLARQGTPHGT